MDINRISRPRWRYFAKGCLIGLTIVSVYCLFDNPYFISLLFSQNEQVINQVANDSQKALDIPFNLFRTFMIITLEYFLFNEFRFYILLCLDHNNYYKDLKRIDFGSDNDIHPNINNDFFNCGIFVIVFLASIPLLVMKIIQIWGGFIPAI